MAAMSVLLGALCLFAVALQGGTAHGAEALGLSAARTGGADRITLRLSEPAGYAVFTLDAPRRVVVDLPKVEWRFAAPPEIAGLRAVSGARFGLFRQGVSRLVLDLRRPARVSAAFTQSGAEGPALVLELTGQTPEAYAAAAGWPPDARPVGARTPPPEKSRAFRHVDGAPVPLRKPAWLSQRKVVVLDPGHGGVDPGAVRDGVTEKTIALDFAHHLRRALGRRGYDVVLTRATDRFLSLRERVLIAHDAGADLFLSLHANTVTRGQARGAAVYTLSAVASDEEARALAEQENRADILAGVNLEGEGDDLARVLVDLSQRETNYDSGQFAEILVAALRPNVAVLKTKPHRSAGFRVLKSASAPSVLLELGFMSDAKDLANMQSPGWRAKAARGVTDAVERWFARPQARTAATR